MKLFSGFQSGKVHIVHLPEPIFSELIPLIDDLTELKVTLHVLWRLGRQSGKVRYMRHADLVRDQVLLDGLGDSPIQALEAGLTRAVARGTLLQVQMPEEEGTLYFANTPKGRKAIEAVERGEWPQALESAARPNIFTLYEQNIGMLTPLIAEELREAEVTYPADWIEEAFREAVSLNKRSWKYIHAILERWQAEGKEDRRDEIDEAAERRRYIEGKYGPYIKH